MRLPFRHSGALFLEPVPALPRLEPVLSLSGRCVVAGVLNMDQRQRAPGPRTRNTARHVVSDPLAQFSRVTAFLAIQCDTQRLHTAIEASSFDNMKTIEDREVREGEADFFFRESSPAGLDAGHRFMSRGKPGGSESVLTAAERAQLLERFGPTMEQIGYSVRG